MKKNTLNKLLILCCLLAMVSCKARKQLASAPGPNNINTAAPGSNTAAKLVPIRAQQSSFTSFSGKAHSKVSINGSSYDVTINIRINNDKEIWASVTYLLGIEIARVKITPDSILLLNKIQSVYVKKPFSYVYTFTNSQVNYSMLQALFVGNAIPSLLNDSTNYQAAKDTITLSGNLQDLMYKLVLGPGLRVAQTNLSNQNEGLSMQVSNNAYIQSGSYQVPSQINIASAAKDKRVQVSLKYYKVDFNLQQDYPFNIPDDYTPVN